MGSYSLLYQEGKIRSTFTVCALGPLIYPRPMVQTWKGVVMGSTSVSVVLSISAGLPIAAQGKTQRNTSVSVFID